MSAAPHAGVGERALLAAWEEGAALGPAQRVLPLLRLEPGASGEDVGRWPLGRRDARLLDFHERAFGGTLSGTAECPGCAEPVELSVPIDRVRTKHAEDVGEHELEHAGHRVRFRLLCADDLAAAERQPDGRAAERTLLGRCVLEAEADGSSVAAADLPEAVTRELERRMAAIDAQADVRLRLACPECGTGWSAAVDPAAFVWRELEDRARATLAEVASLAAAYGWSESEVLALSGERRGAYLELAGA